MKLIEADKVKRVMKGYWKAQVDKALTLTFTDVNEANKRINSYLEHNHDLLKAIDELPSAEPDTTTYDSIPAENGRNDEDRTTDDCISRTQAIDEIHEDAEWLASQGSDWQTERMERDKSILMSLPSVQPETNCSEIPNNWIPCSERLPEIDKEVLVTDGELCWVCSLFESQDIEDGLYQWEDNYGHWHEFETWVAWMPLPEPARLEND